MTISARSHQPIPNTVEFSLDTSTPRRVQPALPAGTKGEEGIHLHGIEVPPPLVSRLGASGEFTSPHIISDRHSTTSTSYGIANLHDIAILPFIVVSKIESARLISSARCVQRFLPYTAISIQIAAPKIERSPHKGDMPIRTCLN